MVHLRYIPVPERKEHVLPFAAFMPGTEVVEWLSSHESMESQGTSEEMAAKCEHSVVCYEPAIQAFFLLENVPSLASQGTVRNFVREAGFVTGWRTFRRRRRRIGSWP